MSLANLLVFSDTLETVSSELIDQEVDKFNAASNGGIVLRTAKNRGDYSSTLKYQLISNLISDRDVDGVGAVSAVDLVRILEGSVKYAKRVGPVNLVPSDYDWIMRSPDEAGATIGTQLAKAKLADMLNSAIAAFVAATLNVGVSLTNDMGATTLTLAGLADGAQLLGDRSQNMACWIMTSKVWTDLYKAGITGANVLFTYGTVNIMADPRGKPLIVTDSSSLFDDPDYYTLGLVPGGIIVEDNGDFRANTVTANMTENITSTYQAQYTYNLGLKGFKWDENTGGRSPDLAAISSGDNWDKTATSVKDCAGVIVVSE